MCGYIYIYIYIYVYINLGHEDLFFQTLSFWAATSLQMVIAAMKLKDAYSLEGKL